MRLPVIGTIAHVYDVQLGQYLEVVAAPGARLVRPIKRGDVLLRRGPGSFAHEAIIASPRLQTAVAAQARGGTPEAHAPGQYAEVIEGGHAPHVRGGGFSRHVTDASGNVPADTLIVRPVELAPDERLDPLSLLLGLQFANVARPPAPPAATTAAAPPDPVTQDEL